MADFAEIPMLVCETWFSVGGTTLSTSKRKASFTAVNSPLCCSLISLQNGAKNLQLPENIQASMFALKQCTFSFFFYQRELSALLLKTERNKMDKQTKRTRGIWRYLHLHARRRCIGLLDLSANAGNVGMCIIFFRSMFHSLYCILMLQQVPTWWFATETRFKIFKILL